MSDRELNEEQRVAAESLEGPYDVTAIPGSGKTFTLVARTENLIRAGVDRRKLLCLTFTNKAANEMKERVSKRLEMKRLPFFVGTFHAMCLQILRGFASEVGYTKSFTTIDSDDQKAMIIKSGRQLGYDMKGKKDDIQKIIRHVNHSRECNESRNEFEDRFEDDADLLMIGSAYLENLKKDNVIDFSGMLYETYQLLDGNDDLCAKMSNRFQYIQVDEVQDTNTIQFDILYKLADQHRNILITGDVDQSIYRFRGARYQNIIDFRKRYDSTSLHLSKNYRSTPEIIEVSDRLIKHNSTHPDIEFVTDNASGQPVECINLNDQDEEAQEVARKIKYYINQEGWDPQDIAVFYRVNKLSMDLQLTFSRYNIPFKVIGGPSFFDRAEIKDSMAMLKFLINSDDTLSFARVANLFTGVGAGSINTIESISRNNGISILDACKDIQSHTTKKTVIKAAELIEKSFDFDYSGMNAAESLDTIVKSMEYYGYLEKKYEYLQSQERQENIETLMTNAEKYASNNQPTVEAYLNNIALLTSSDINSEAGSVSMMTIHASKGLEFPVVFIVGVEEGLMPHCRAFEDDNPVEAVEEERRICYVGFTRAERRLHLTHCDWRQERGQEGKIRYAPKKPSPFLYDSGLLKRELKDLKHERDF